jgi:hypothetical protein
LSPLALRILSQAKISHSNSPAPAISTDTSNPPNLERLSEALQDAVQNARVVAATFDSCDVVSRDLLREYPAGYTFSSFQLGTDELRAKEFQCYFRNDDADYLRNAFRSLANVDLNAVIAASTLVNVIAAPPLSLLSPRLARTLLIHDDLWSRCGGNPGSNAYIVPSIDFTQAIIYICDSFFVWPSIEEIANPARKPWARDAASNPFLGYSCNGLGFSDSG